MAYQVLARKWRPKNFHEVMGQQHVLQALSNALDQGRLHHAYLFTGTRGVGKTTIARILAKSLNCETGITSHPCGQCSACQEIDRGNFVDLLEIDAASRTKVEDTRDLLDNVQYKPARGRFKIYLIDEVHMLSRHSFNALLKTLEEPPEHVKFLLATTDPQKLPITILSRCLQFNLKALSPEQITNQLTTVLQAEQVTFDTTSLSLLAKAAQGSMRDALSLTDQAIAYGNGELQSNVISQMLGSIDQQYLTRLLDVFIQKDTVAVMQQIAELAMTAPEYDLVFSELAALLHQIAMLQLLGQSSQQIEPQSSLFHFAENVSAESLQLWYQIVLQGRKELPYAPDGRSALEMTFLRMLAFTPQLEAPVLSSRRIALPAEKKTEISLTAQPVAQVTKPETISVEAISDTSLEDEAMLSRLNAEQAEILAKAAVEMPLADQMSSAQIVDQPEQTQAKTPVEAKSGLDDVLRFRNQLRSRRMQNDNAATTAIAAPAYAPPARGAVPETLSTSPANTYESAPPEVVPPAQQVSSPIEPTKPSFQPLEDDLPPWELPPLDAYQDEFVPTSKFEPEIQPVVFDGQAAEPTPRSLFQKIDSNKSTIAATHANSMMAFERVAPVVEVDESDESVWRSNELLARSQDPWANLVASLPVTGRTRQLAMHAILERSSDFHWILHVRNDAKHLTQARIVAELSQAIQSKEQTSAQITVNVVAQTMSPCPIDIEHQERLNLQQYAEQLLKDDPNVQILQERFGAILDNGSIQPLKTTKQTT